MSSEKHPIILWFRQDLRLTDNPALLEAVASGAPIIPVYIDDIETPKEWQWGGASKWWLHHSLSNLSKNIRDKGASLIIRKGKPIDILQEIIKETGAQHVFWNRVYEPFNIARDKAIKETLKDNDIDVKSFSALLINEPWTVENKTGGFYKVYTPFSKTCFAKGEPEAPKPAPKIMNGYDTIIDGLSIDDLDLLPDIKWDGDFPTYWTPGEKGASEKLERFIESGAIKTYYEDRNRPDLEGVSRLSAHMHWGEISPKQIWHRVRLYEHGLSESESDKLTRKSSNHYLKELLWREFSYHLLYYLDDMPRKPLNEKFYHFPWNDNDDHLEAWKRGKTGYPIVDAAMRELWQTGWMHNRSRMIVGSFLVKHLRLHWHHGEDWFWDCLVDADLASNAASWQWIAGCGADAAPYFRIFNPIIQSKKFDPNGDYIRKFVPELKDVPTEMIHTPWEFSPEKLKKYGVTLDETYPRPIVDHGTARNEALEAYKELKNLDVA